MAYRLVCDRCGATINPASSGVIVGYNMDCWNDPKEKYELCVSCALRFKHWMKSSFPVIFDEEGGGEK